jgi:putative phosphoribosyl transferase
MTVRFADRIDAGRKLAVPLAKYQDQRAVVLALPRGGVPVAREVAIGLNAALDLVLVRKIGVPDEPELAMGAVVDGPEPITVQNADVVRFSRVSDAEFEAARAAELAEIRRRRTRLLGNRPHVRLAGRTAIVVDDGIATGATMRAALRAVRQQRPAKLVLAVPVAPASALAELRGEADEVVCLDDREGLGSVGSFYADFTQVSDDEVRDILAQFPVGPPVSAGLAP